MRILFTLLAMFGLTGSKIVDAADWLQFRGSNGDGVSPVQDLPTTWSASEHVRWLCKLPGEGWSSPVVVGKRIYLSTAIAQNEGSTETARELALLIVDADSGQLVKRVALFTEPTDSPKIHKKNSHASPTPLVVGERVFVHFGHMGTACTDLAGNIVWRNDKLTYAPVHGNGGSPVVVGNALIFSQDSSTEGKVVALNTQTGEVLWTLARNVEASKKFSFCTPMVLQQAGQTQVILPGSNVVQAINPIDGREIWRVRYDGYSVIPKPIIAGGLIMVCTGYDRPTLLAIKPGGQGDVTDSHVAWQTKTAVAHTPSLSTRDGLLFMISDAGIATCWDASTGKEIWKERIGGNFSASPLLVDDKLYLLSEDGETTIIRASAKFEKLSQSSLGEATLASMAVIDHDLLIRARSGLYRITK